MGLRCYGREAVTESEPRQLRADTEEPRQCQGEGSNWSRTWPEEREVAVVGSGPEKDRCKGKGWLRRWWSRAGRTGRDWKRRRAKSGGVAASWLEAGDWRRRPEAEVEMRSQAEAETGPKERREKKCFANNGILSEDAPLRDLLFRC